MAITIRTQPANYMPVYNRIEYSCSSSNYTQPNFKFTFKLYIDGVLSDTWRVPPRPTVNFAIQDFSRALQREIVEYISQPNVTSIFSYAVTRPIQKYRVDIVEYYGTNPVEDAETLITGDDKYIWSGSFSAHDWIDQINEPAPFNTWLMNTTNGTKAQFLTRYKTPDITMDDAGWHWAMSDAPTDMDYVEIKTYDSVGALIQTAQVTNPLTMTTVPARILAVMTAPYSLNTYSGAFISGSAPIIASNTSTYTIQIFKTGGAPMSEILTFTLKDPCRYDQYRIHFLNELGGIEAYNFQSRSQPSTEIMRKSYTRNEDFFDGVGNVDYGHYRNGSQDYYVKTIDKLKLRSEYLSEEEHDWLKELLESPQLWVEFTDMKGLQNFKPVKVTSRSWTKKTIGLDKLFKLEIDLEYGLENFRQRR